MRPVSRQKLRAAYDLVEQRRNENASPAAIIAELVANHGASYNRDHDTNRLRVGGVGASCTWSADTGLLGNWKRTANRHLMRADAVGLRLMRANANGVLGA